MADPKKSTGEPAWLADLHPINRLRARRWLHQAGEARFMAIATAATSIKRPKHRPALDYSPQILEAAVVWISSPHMDETEAARVAAKSIVKEQAWSGRTPLEEPALRRRLREGLRGMTMGTMAAAEAVAIQRGLPSRIGHPIQDALQRMESQWKRLRRISPAAIGANIGTTSPPRLAGLGDELAKSTKRLTEPMENMIKGFERVTNLAKALDGLIDPETPVTVLTTALNDLATALNSRRPKRE